MRTLPMPRRDAAREELITAIEVRQRNGRTVGYPATKAELDAVITLYDEYDAVGGMPGEALKGANLEMALRTAIQSGYELMQSGRRLAAVRAGLMLGIEHCPICGISPPRALDHYLPKSSYSPLSIYVRNLVPVCAECNQAKSASASVRPEQQFVHPYFDRIPKERFLRAEPIIRNGGLLVKFSIEPSSEMCEVMLARLTYQLERLHLEERYAREINSALTSYTVALYMCYAADRANGVRDYLQCQAAVEFEQFHANHWRPVLLSALGIHEDFCAGGFRTVLSEPINLPGGEAPAQIVPC